jgi:hypothetical protein
VAEQQQRRAVGPLEVVEHEQHRRRTRQVGEQPDDRLEQPVALGLGLVLRWRRKVRDAPAQLGNQPRELGSVLARVRAEIGDQRVQRPVPQRLEERLVGNHGLARRASREHDRAGVVYSPRQLARQRRLADPGVPREQHYPATGSVGLRSPTGATAATTTREIPKLLEFGKLLPAPDQRPLPAVAELRRERNRRQALIGTLPRVVPAGLGPQQPLVRGNRLGRRVRPELVAEQRPQPVEHAQRLGDVAARGERLHQQDVARLAVRLSFDQRPRRAFGRLELGAAHQEAGAADHLERLLAHVLELAAGSLEPGRLGAR